MGDQDRCQAEMGPVSLGSSMFRVIADVNELPASSDIDNRKMHDRCDPRSLPLPPKQGAMMMAWAEMPCTNVPTLMAQGLECGVEQPRRCLRH